MTTILRIVVITLLLAACGDGAGDTTADIEPADEATQLADESAADEPAAAQPAGDEPPPCDLLTAEDIDAQIPGHAFEARHEGAGCNYVSETPFAMVIYIPQAGLLTRAGGTWDDYVRHAAGAGSQEGAGGFVGDDVEEVSGIGDGALWLKGGYVDQLHAHKGEHVLVMQVSARGDEQDMADAEALARLFMDRW